MGFLDLDMELTDPRCVHCSAWTTYTSDPAPDLCLLCRNRGLLSPMWDEEQERRHQENLRRQWREIGT